MLRPRPPPTFDHPRNNAYMRVCVCVCVCENQPTVRTVSTLHSYLATVLHSICHNNNIAYRHNTKLETNAQIVVTTKCQLEQSS